MPKWLTYSLLSIVVLLVGLALAGPIGPLPGLLIGGNAAETPQSWSEVELPEEILLEATGGWLPRVVTIWVVEANNALYIIGTKDGGWVEAATASKDVRVRIDDNTFALSATRLEVVDEEIYQQYVDRYAPNYPDIIAGMPPSNQIADTVAAFRLAARQH